MNDRRGFTLIEIMIALTILGIMVVIATTNLQLWQSHYSGVGFQREFLSQFNEARTRSMASSQEMGRNSPEPFAPVLKRG